MWVLGSVTNRFHHSQGHSDPSKLLKAKTSERVGTVLLPHPHCYPLLELVCVREKILKRYLLFSNFAKSVFITLPLCIC